MKFKVTNGFIDKNTDKPYSIGDIYECDEPRAKEIMHAGDYIVKLECDNVKTEKKAFLNKK